MRVARAIYRLVPAPSPRRLFSFWFVRGVTQWDTEKDQFTEREKLRSVRAVVRVLIRRGSICCHSGSRVHPTRMTCQSRPQTGVFQLLGFSVCLNVQSHHLGWFFKTSWFAKTVVPQVLPSPVLRRNASELSFERIVKEPTTTIKQKNQLPSSLMRELRVKTVDVPRSIVKQCVALHISRSQSVLFDN